MTENFEKSIQILQDNLCDLRKIAGWTAETFAGKLGVTKQTISNLETHKVKMSKMQFIAIRSVFECETYLSPDNTTLRKVLHLLFDLIPLSYEQDKEKIRTAITSIASISNAGISGLQLLSSATALLAPINVPSTPYLYKNSQPSLEWLASMLQSDHISRNTYDEDVDTEKRGENI